MSQGPGARCLVINSTHQEEVIMSTVITQPGPGVELAARRRMARVPITRPPGLTGRLLSWLSRRMLGQEPETGWAMAANRKVLFATLGFERRVAGFDRLDPGLGKLAVMAVAQQVGCSWCVDFGYFMA